MQLTPTILHSDMLTHCAETKSFTCEASDLHYPPSQVWDDACDEGYTIISSRTGNQSVWAHYNNEYDPEGDLTGSNFTPTPETMRKFPQLRDYRLTVFND